MMSDLNRNSISKVTNINSDNLYERAIHVTDKMTNSNKQVFKIKLVFDVIFPIRNIKNIGTMIIS